MHCDSISPRPPLNKDLDAPNSQNPYALLIFKYDRNRKVHPFRFLFLNNLLFPVVPLILNAEIRIETPLERGLVLRAGAKRQFFFLSSWIKKTFFFRIFYQKYTKGMYKR